MILCGEPAVLTSAYEVSLGIDRLLNLFAKRRYGYVSLDSIIAYLNTEYSSPLFPLNLMDGLLVLALLS
jgi:hypothetical protein